MKDIIGTERYILAKDKKHRELAIHLAQRYGWTYGYSKTMAQDLINQVQVYIDNRKNNKMNIEPSLYGNYNHQEYVNKNKKETKCF